MANARVLVAVAALTLAGCGAHPKPAVSARTGPSFSQGQARLPGPASGAQVGIPGVGPHRLLVGVTEADPSFVWTPSARPRIGRPEADRWRPALDAVHPAVYRLFVDWGQVQSTPGLAPNWDLPRDGCLRSPPCLPWAGVREQLDAARSRQQQEGVTVLVVLTDPPAWAAAAAIPGCRVPGLRPSTNGVATSALPAYAELVGELLALAAHEGVSIGYLSPFNEPNLPRLLSPQRALCSAHAPSLAPERYAALVRALRPVLAGTGAPRLVLGETAGYGAPGPLRTGAVEFVAGLPRDVVCSSDIWSQHVYVSPVRTGAVGHQTEVFDARGAWDAAGSVRFLSSLHAALLARGCQHTPRIWVTETGAGGPVAGNPRSSDPTSERLACSQMASALAGWDALGFVDVAAQYSFREDALYPVGLVDPALTRAHATLALWQAWGQRAPSAPPPSPRVCDRG